VADSTLAELQALDVGTWKAARYRGERMPTLAQVLDVVPPGKKILIEIKSGPEIVPKLVEVLQATQLPRSQIIVIAFQEPVVVAVKRHLPELKVYWLAGFKQDKQTKVWSPTVDELLRTFDRLPADGLDVQGNRQFVDRTLVDQLRQRGKEFHVWTIDEPDDARHFQSLGADSITTNRPAAIRAALQ